MLRGRFERRAGAVEQVVPPTVGVVPHGVLEIAEAVLGGLPQDGGLGGSGGGPRGGQGVPRLEFEHLVVQPGRSPPIIEVAEEPAVLPIDTPREPGTQQRKQLGFHLPRDASLNGGLALPSPASAKKPHAAIIPRSSAACDQVPA